MKNVKTLVLIMIIIILLIIKFFPENKALDNKKGLETSIISINMTDVEKQELYYLDKTPDEKYNFSLVYIVLFDDISSSLIPDLKESFQNRLNLFDEFIEKESLGKIISNSKLFFLNIKEFNSKSLSYDKTIFDWIKIFDEKIDVYYNILAFAPIYEMDWCNDGRSQGFNYDSKIFFCLESFFNPSYEIENRGAVGLMLHKILHGVGYNHQNQLYKQYTFLDWNMGLPETNILLHGNFRDFNNSFLDEHTLKVLNIINRTDFERTCSDNKTFICKSKKTFFCEDSWGPSCQDIDKDEIIDSEDNYVFSSPLKGNDSDNDGIVNQLDLCDWNEISIIGNGVVSGPLKIKTSQRKVEISFSGEKIQISKIMITPFEMIGGFIKFDDKKTIEKNESKIIISQQESPLWRIQVFYDYKEQTYFRPFYLYFTSFDADFFYEREWYYFNRFGCDVPANIDFSYKDSYDSDLDGLPDYETFEWTTKINENYDWDDDGFSDTIDTLPTIKGNCTNIFVKGVKDSDNDGFCDPGRFDFSSKRYVEKYEISIIADYNEFSDFCPYIFGTNQGCS